jgi:hypothetical protein
MNVDSAELITYLISRERSWLDYIFPAHTLPADTPPTYCTFSQPGNLWENLVRNALRNTPATWILCSLPGTCKAQVTWYCTEGC